MIDDDDERAKLAKRINIQPKESRACMLTLHATFTYTYILFPCLKLALCPFLLTYYLLTCYVSRDLLINYN